MKHKGFQYDFSPEELKYFLFGKKRCPHCEGELLREKAFETVNSRELNTRSDPIFVQDVPIKHYLYYYTCQSCGHRFSLHELASRKG